MATIPYAIVPTPISTRSIPELDLTGTLVPVNSAAMAAFNTGMHCMDTSNLKSFAILNAGGGSTTTISFREFYYSIGSTIDHSVLLFWSVAQNSASASLFLANGNDLWVSMIAAGGTGSASAAAGTFVRLRRTTLYDAFVHQLTVTPPVVAGKTVSLITSIDTDNIAVIYKDNTTHRLDDMRVYNITGASFSTKNAPYATNNNFAETSFGTLFINNNLISGRTQDGFFLGCPTSVGFRVMRYRLATNTWINILNGSGTGGAKGLSCDPDDDTYLFVNSSSIGYLFVEGATNVYTPMGLGNLINLTTEAGNMDFSVGVGPISTQNNSATSVVKIMTTTGRIEYFTSSLSGIEQSDSTVVILRGGLLLKYQRTGFVASNGRLGITLNIGDLVIFGSNNNSNIRNIAIFLD